MSNNQNNKNEKVVPRLGGIYKNGYGIIARAPMKDDRISPTAKLIYSYLCSYTNAGDNEAFPGYKTICEDLGMNKDTFFLNVKYLKGYGYITTYKREGTNNNIYIIEPVVRENQKILKELEKKQEKIKTNNKKAKNKREIAKKLEDRYRQEIETNVNVPNNSEHGGIPNNSEHGIPNNSEHGIPNNSEHGIPNNSESIKSTYKKQLLLTNNNRKKASKNKLIELENQQVLELQEKFKNTTNKNATEKYIKELLKDTNFENINTVLNKYNKILPVTKKVQSVYGFVRDACKAELENKPYQENIKDDRQIIDKNKPVQAQNYEQREYGDEFFEEQENAMYTVEEENIETLENKKEIIELGQNIFMKVGFNGEYTEKEIEEITLNRLKEKYHITTDYEIAMYSNYKQAILNYINKKVKEYV